MGSEKVAKSGNSRKMSLFSQKRPFFTKKTVFFGGLKIEGSFFAQK